MMRTELLRFIFPARAPWRSSAASNDVALVRRSLEYKLRAQNRLTPAEQYLLKNLSHLENKLFAPKVGETVREISFAFLRPLLMTGACIGVYCIAPTELSSDPRLLAQASSFLGDDDGSDAVLPDDETLAADGAENPVDMPQLAMAIAAEYDKTAADEEALLRQIVTAPAPAVPATGLGLSTALPALTDPSAMPDTTVETASLGGSVGSRDNALRHQRNLVKFISGLIAAYRPTIKDCGAIAKQIVEVSAADGVDPIFVASIIAIESRFASNAQSNRGALGLMQLRPSTAREVAKNQRRRLLLDEHLADPKTNIRLGISYLKQLEQKYRGNRFLALAAYNWGPANIDRVHGRAAAIPGSVKNYSRSILERTVSWRRHFLKAIDTAEELQVAMPTNRSTSQG